MANIKISQLTAAASATGTQEFEINDSGTSKKVTGSQIKTFVKDGLVISDLSGVTTTATELNVLSGIPATLTATELGYVDGVTSAIQTQINTKAPLASPALTGTPTAPTATVGTNTTQLATTAFVLANSGAPNIQTFTSSGTWTKPAGATLVLVRLLGGGGGGASGQAVNSTNPLTGGGGGAGAALYEAYIAASGLTSTVTVTVGAGGAGAAGGVTNAGPGSVGSRTTFGSYVITDQAAYGYNLFTLSPNAFGGVAERGAGDGGAGAIYNNGVGGEGFNAFAIYAGGGGGGGGGWSSSIGWRSGGAGGGNTVRGTSGGAAGTSAGASGSAGGVASGGGGGASASSGVGGAGGAGSFPGGGGGGGGSSRTSTIAAGGTGGAGYAEIWSW